MSLYEYEYAKVSCCSVLSIYLVMRLAVKIINNSRKNVKFPPFACESHDCQDMPIYQSTASIIFSLIIDAAAARRCFFGGAYFLQRNTFNELVFVKAAEIKIS